MLWVTLILVVMIALAIIAIVGILAIVGNAFGLILTLIFAGLIGLLAERITTRIAPSEMPFGFLGAIFAGIIGSWLGSLLLGHVGPVIFGIPVISALVGAIIVTLIYSLVVGRAYRQPT
jgi:uncharacterized membrane protein YeaQ/YmgE (transglycosylase-associated protein family)